jgi:hypothetical protein|tara:strand:+ start:459 stop:827 length:369 start_codon:yes stop_codon:yes gene_type:complete
MDKQYDDEKKGYLWHENNSVIERKGSFTIDGKKYYGAIIKSHNDKGEYKYEFMASLGLLHLNAEKRSDKSPDMGGKITLNNKVYKLGCWARESENGTPYTSLGFTDAEESTSEYTERPKASF